MTTGAEYLGYRRLRAPRENGAGLFEPAWDDIGRLVAENLQGRATACYDVQGKCLSQLARQARAELLEAARRWTGDYRDVGPWANVAGDRIFLAGHQPQMFHPGVWLKNFALSRLAQDHQAVAVNLIVDSDTIRSHTLAVPGGSADEPFVEEIAFDAGGPAIPFEERRILDPALFATFADRVQRQIRPLVARPLIAEYWPRVCERARFTDRLGLCLAQARHALEGEWGVGSLEVPQSTVCDCDSFRWFACHLLDEAERFRRDHNQVLADYRRVHRIRSAAHPAADLAQQDGWQETPFWVWSVESPRRRRLFVHRSADRLQMTDRHGLEFSLPMRSGGDASQAVDRLRLLHSEGIRIRCRALITTMWARLALGDLFVHGIGGAKYDQVTDALIARFFRLKPPGFLTVSGTLHLPIPHDKVVSEDLGHLRERIRQLEFQPERFFDNLDNSSVEGIAEARRLAAEKWSWVQANITAENYRERFLCIRRLNKRMQAWVEPVRGETLVALQEAERAARAASVLTWREYAFCLFPGDGLQNFFSRLLPKRA